MGWTVLYIAFGIVALWLLGEVLLQYKARLRWRLLAFAGFLCVVVGVLLPSVTVIGAGAAAFAIGQTYVTLSFRRGFAAGWAVRHPDPEGTKRRRGKGERTDPALQNPGLDDTGDGHDDAGAGDGAAAAAGRVPYGYEDDHDRDDVFSPARPAAAETTAVYEPQPLPDDTGSYGVYGDVPRQTGTNTAYAATGQFPTQDQYATAAQGADQGYGYDYSGHDQQGYGYDGTGQQGYAAYSDPYNGAQAYGDGSYGTAYGAQQGYGYDGTGQQGYGTQDPYATGGYGGHTPAGGVWVPQQRTEESYGGELPPERSYPYPGGTQGQAQHGAGFDEQYRF